MSDGEPPPGHDCTSDRDPDTTRVTTTRRRVLRRVAGTAGLVRLEGASAVESGHDNSVRAAPTPTASASGRQHATDAQDEDDLEGIPFLDAHTHLIPTEAWGREPLSADDLVSWMDARGVDQAVVLPLESPEAYPVSAPSWWVLEEVSAHPDRLLPFCSIDPRAFVYPEQRIVDQLERSVRRGARGFGELKPGLRIDDPRLERVYDLCAEYDLPVLFHTDDKAMIDDVGLPGLEGVLGSYPDVDFVAHAMGWWAHISADVTADDRGGYPDGPVEPGGRVPELLGTYDNLYGDLAGGSGWNALTRDETFAQAFLERHHGQLVFGTDYLSPDLQVPHFQLFDRFDLERDAWADIRYRNLESVLR